MKKLLIFLTVIIAFLSFSPAVYAIDFCPFGQFTKLCQLNPNDNTNVVGNVFTIMLVVAVILSVGFLIFGGIRWIVAGGDKGKVDSARATITGAIIGLIISFAAFFILSFVNYLFGIDSSNGTIFQLPHLFDNPNTGPSTYQNRLPLCSSIPDDSPDFQREHAQQAGTCR